MNIILFLLFSFNVNAETLNAVLAKIDSSHTSLGNNNVNYFRNIETTSKKHMLLKFNEDPNTYYELDIIQNLNQNEMDRTLKTNLLFIKQLYLNKPTPYSGMVSQTIQCEKNLNPTVVNLLHNKQNFEVIIAPLGKNLQFGSCQKNDVSYWSCNAFLKQPKNLVSIKIYSKSKASLNCRTRVKNFVEGYIEK